MISRRILGLADRLGGFGSGFRIARISSPEIKNVMVWMMLAVIAEES